MSNNELIEALKQAKDASTSVRSASYDPYDATEWNEWVGYEKALSDMMQYINDAGGDRMAFDAIRQEASLRSIECP